MRRLSILLLAIFLCLPILSGCAQNNEKKAMFDFSYDLEKTEYIRGDTVKITATVTNVSGKTYRYTGCSGNDFIPLISMYNDSDGSKYYIYCDPIALPTDVVEKKIKNGESGSIVYSFVIPKDAKLGTYSITLSLGDDKREFTNVLKITEQTFQNQNENFYYSTIKISSGDEYINPIETLFYQNEYSMDGSPFLFADGAGSYGIFSDTETRLSDFPTLVTNEEITVSAPSYSDITVPRIRDANYEELDLKIKGWDVLHLLPEGEYVVVFGEITDSRDMRDETESYWITCNENVFRLIIPQRRLGENYHSLVITDDENALTDDFDRNAKYRAGERVELKLAMVTEQYYEVFVNGEEIPMLGWDAYTNVFAFIMPDCDAEIEIKSVPVDIPKE